MKIISMTRVTCTIRWAGPSPLLPRTTELFNSLFYNTSLIIDVESLLTSSQKVQILMKNHKSIHLFSSLLGENPALECNACLATQHVDIDRKGTYLCQISFSDR